jgi:transposase InsO family protein
VKQIWINVKYVPRPKLLRSHVNLLQEKMIIHSDLGHLRHTMTRSGKKYYVIFFDDYSRFSKLYLLRTNDEALEMFIKYKIEVEKQKNKMIKRLKTDRSGKYESNPFKEFCEQNGIIHEVTPPYSPESNGVDERNNRTLKEIMNVMLVSSGLPTNM